MVVGPSRVAGTLAAHLADVDATRFVGRSPLLARVDRLLAGEEATRVLLVHGPGGIGKSALLREVDRRARAAGRPTWMVDARHLGPAPDELHRAVEAAHDRPGAVVLIDSFERVGALGRQRREELLGNLAEDALVVVAGRGVPSPAWFHDGWEHVVTDVPLGPLSPDEARALLAARGVTDPGIADGLVRWAAGSPLALSLAAAGSDADGNAAGGSRTGRSPDGMPGGVDLNELIVRRLAGDELGAVDREVLDVAAVARAVDARLLAAVLPGRPTRAAGEALRRSHVAEVVGGRVSLHELVRNALRDDLRRRDPQRYDRLRCAIADHLLVRALSTSDTRLLADMTQLIDDADRRRDVETDAVTAVDPGAPGARRVGDPVDGGPGGLLVHIRRMIYAEAGLDAPDLYPDDDDELQAAAVDAVRDATRPDLLATNPLVDRAPGGRVGERVAWVQDAIRSGLGTAFGSGDGDRVLRQVVALGDLDPETNHVQAMSQLSMSRATYFRHLRRARERLARALVERVTDQTP